MRNHPERKRIRMAGYNYSRSGYYFVTICTQDREQYFGEIIDGKMKLSVIGRMADDYWRDIPIHFPDVILDEYVIMPDHIHGIVVIEYNGGHSVGNENFRSLQRHDTVIPWCGAQSRSLSSIIRGFKIGVTKWCRKKQYGFEWQKSFHDRIIWNEYQLNRVREYIKNNPLKWWLDRH